MYKHNTHTHLHAYMHSSIAYIHVNPSSTYVYIYIYTQDLYAYTERNTEGTFTSASASGPTTVSTTFAPDEAPHPMVLSAHGGSPTAPAPGLPDSARQKTSSTEGGELTVTIELSTSRTAPSNSIRTRRNTPCVEPAEPGCRGWGLGCRAASNNHTNNILQRQHLQRERESARKSAQLLRASSEQPPRTRRMAVGMAPAPLSYPREGFASFVLQTKTSKVLVPVL